MVSMLLGQGKMSNGENAYAFDSGTARVTVDERSDPASLQVLGRRSARPTAPVLVRSSASPPSAVARLAAPETFAGNCSGRGSELQLTTRPFNTYTVSLLW